MVNIYLIEKPDEIKGEKEGPESGLSTSWRECHAGPKQSPETDRRAWGVLPQRSLYHPADINLFKLEITIEMYHSGLLYIVLNTPRLILLVVC